MKLKYLISTVLYIIFLGHVGLCYAAYTQGFGWLLAAPILIGFDMFIIPRAIEDWNE